MRGRYQVGRVGTEMGVISGRYHLQPANSLFGEVEAHLAVVCPFRNDFEDPCLPGCAGCTVCDDEVNPEGIVAF